MPPARLSTASFSALMHTVCFESPESLDVQLSPEVTKALRGDLRSHDLLYAAVMRDDASIIRLLLERQVCFKDVRTPTGYYTTAMTLALEESCMEAVKTLLRFCFGLVMPLENLSAALETARKLIRQPDFTATDLERLIQRQLPINSGRPEAGLPLIFTVIEAQRADLMAVFIRHHGGIDGHCLFPDGLRRSPLMAAARNGWIEGCEMLLDAGVRSNAMSDHRTALHEVVASDLLSAMDKERAALALITKGAHPKRRYPPHPSSYDLALSTGQSQLAELMQTAALCVGPDHVRQARARNIRDLEIHYSKADGLILRLADFDYAVFIGGDYNGAYPTRTGNITRFGLPDQPPLTPFLRSQIAALDRGESIDLDALLQRFPDGIYTEDDRANWHC
jgi:hypothetical protein